MAQLFLSHQFTKEDKVVLYELLTKIVNAFQKQGHTTFCSTLIQDHITSLNLVTYEERLAYCLEQQLKADCIVALFISKNPSFGMQKELELAKEHRQKYLLFSPYYDEFLQYKEYAHKTVYYTDPDDLLQQLENMPRYYEEIGVAGLEPATSRTRNVHSTN